MSMAKIFLFMWLCSGVAGNECIQIQTPKSEFKDMYNCTVYGYKYSYETIKGFKREFINEHKAFTKFTCKSQQTV